jgi:hypothetical protein
MLTTMSNINEIFVFGSNEAGRHGKGAALTARSKYGARYGQGSGRQGDSYAIPTKDKHLNTLPIEYIKPYVIKFCEYAFDHPELKFYVTRIGCGLAGYKEKDIRPLFDNWMEKYGILENCRFSWEDND